MTTTDDQLRAIVRGESGSQSSTETIRAIADELLRSRAAADLPDLDAAIGVWHDLDRALAGKNGYGGDVAEIYAYRLVPPRLRQRNTVEEAEEQAPLAGRNLTQILRRFADLHEGTAFEIEEGRGVFVAIDLVEGGAGCPAFSHRIHLRVSNVSRARRQLADGLLALWNRARDLEALLPQPDFTAWSGATKDLLIALGMEWDARSEAYVIRRKP